MTEVRCSFFTSDRFEIGNYLLLVMARIFFFRSYCIISLLWTNVVVGTTRFQLVYLLISIFVMHITPFFQTCEIDDGVYVVSNLNDRVGCILKVIDFFILSFTFARYSDKMKTILRCVNSSRIGYEKVALLSPMDSSHKHKT